jgi:hypothetical protein
LQRFGRIPVKNHSLSILAASALTATIFAAPAFAADRSKGNEGTGEAPRSMTTVKLRAAMARPMPQVDLEAASRALELSPERAAKAYGVIGRSSDGREIRLAPSQKILDAIKAQKG